MATVTSDRAAHLCHDGARPAVDRLDVEIDVGELVALVVPSGCGESSALRMLAGPADFGNVHIGHRDVALVPPEYHELVVPAAGLSSVDRGDAVSSAAVPGSIHLVDTAAGQRLPEP